MISMIWGSLIGISVFAGILMGNAQGLTTSFLDGAKNAVELSVFMLGVVGMWSGIMEIAADAGILNKLSNKMKPLLNLLYPNLVHKKSEALNYIALNMAANFLGLGWAATPPAIKAMKLMNEDNPQKERATDEMCTFLIINISSLQLIPMNIVAYRSQYGSMNPSAILVPGFIATSISTAAAILFCLWKREKI